MMAADVSDMDAFITPAIGLLNWNDSIGYFWLF